MGIFKKTVKYSKASKDLDSKIKILDEGLKKTGVILEQNDADCFLVEEKQEKNIPKIVDKIEVIKEKEQLYNWRETLLEENIEDDILKENYNEIPTLTRVEHYISESNKDLIILRDQIFKEISEQTLLDLPEIKNKISKVLEIYDELQEGLLNEPPETKNEDPLTPLNQNFVTPEDLNKHYTLFINRIQEQLATLGGGGETKLKYLDDVVGIATNASAYDGKFLSYNHSLGKFEFVGVAFTAGGAGIGISIGENPPTDTTLYPLWFNSIVGRSFIYYTDQDGSQWVDFSPSTQVPKGESYWALSTSGIHTTSNVGVGTTNPTTKLEVQSGDIKVGVNTSSGVILTSPNGLQYRLIVDDSGNLSTTFVS